MRIVYFAAGGTLGFLPLRYLAERYEIVAVVRPVSPGSRLRRGLASLLRRARGRAPDLIEQFTRARHIRSLPARSGRDPLLISQLAALQPDLMCVATFPWLLAPALFTLPPCGTLNLHPSLLPRHRGPAPLFWVYYHNDRQTGVTVHCVNARADAGDILCQEAFPLPRGFHIRDLHTTGAQCGARLLLQAVEAVRLGKAVPVPQAAALATPAPRVRRGGSMVNFAAWDVERVWHFLAGLYPQFLEPLVDDAGAPVHYRQVLGYAALDHARRLGSLEWTGDGWHLYCLGGVVHLAGARSRRRRGAIRWRTS